MINPESPDSLLAFGRDALIQAAFFTGDFDQAETLLKIALSAAQSHNDQQTLAGALDQLGFLQHWRNVDLTPENRDIHTELDLFERALVLRQQLHDIPGIAESLFHVALVHQLFNRDYPTALTYLEQALPLSQQSGDHILISEIHRHIGAHHWVYTRDFDRALTHFRTSLDLRQQTNLPQWIASGLITLGQCEFAAGQRTEAAEHLRQGALLAQESAMRDLWVRTARDALAKAA